MRKPKKVILKNGLRVILVPQPSSLAASILILVEAGSEYETKATNGLSHFLEHMTFKGTTIRPRPGMIAEELASLGAQSNAFTAQEYTGYWAKAEGRKVHKLFDILSDLYLNPIFAEEEIEKEKGVIVEEINMTEDTPMRKIFDIFMSCLYGDQPAGWDVGGTKENIRKFTRKDFMKYRGARYVPNTTVMVVAGKFDEKKIMGAVRKTFGSLKRRPAPKKVKTRERQSSPRIMLKFKESDQGHLALGFRGITIFDKRRYALQVLADVLGGSMSSRLFKKVRDELGAAYYISSDTDLSIDHGSFAVFAGVDHAKIEVVIKAILEECRRLRDELVPEKELQRAKDHMLGNLILGLETSDELGSFYGGQEIMTGSLLPPETIADRIKGITAEEVRAAARAIFRKQGLNLAIIGPYRNEEIFEKILTI